MKEVFTKVRVRKLTGKPVVITPPGCESEARCIHSSDVITQLLSKQWQAEPSESTPICCPQTSRLRLLWPFLLPVIPSPESGYPDVLPLEPLVCPFLCS